MPPAPYTQAMHRAAETALAAYDLPRPATVAPIRLLNNAVYEVTAADGRRYALRVH
ncbi:hypothetical protein AB0K52_09775 [Glycomyces sp. NPDC049804]|uniref:hypothetical protein n=1 Tax=Glycomyces sp. NPDC049804 TaxID=3154363 RepID=UPI00341F0AA0